MKNRYDGLLEEYNTPILELIPANQTLRAITGMEIEKAVQGMSTPNILELGCGQGHQTEYIDSAVSSARISAVDISTHMLNKCEARIFLRGRSLECARNHYEFIEEDALKFLEAAKGEGNAYDVIAQAWTFHNFTNSQRSTMYTAIHDCLSPSGSLIMMDKVYSGNNWDDEKWFAKQLRRFSYLPDHVCKEMIAHEEQDAEYPFIMFEGPTKKELEELGFEVSLADRVERDVVIVARKK